MQFLSEYYFLFNAWAILKNHSLGNRLAAQLWYGYNCRCMA